MKFIFLSFCFWCFASGLYSLIMKEDASGWWYIGISMLVCIVYVLSTTENSQKKHGL